MAHLMIRWAKLSDRTKKIVALILTSLFIGLTLIAFNTKFPLFFTTFDQKFYDVMFHIRGEQQGDRDIVIVDIDEKSLATHGQWPWSRHQVARLLEIMRDQGAAIIGMDIVFPEYDRTSPSRILPHATKALDYDVVLAQTLKRSPVVLGYQFDMGDKRYLHHDTPQIPIVFIEQGDQKSQGYVIEAQGAILNNPLLQQAALTSGFFNNTPDPNGVTRTVPLVMRYQGQLYPSLVLEMLRSALGIRQVIVTYNELGVEKVKLGDLVIPTDRYGRMVVNFRGKEGAYRYVSAGDLLDGTIDGSQLRNKIVFVGTSAAGLLDLRATPFEAVFPGVEIHATAFDTIINQSFLHRPSWIEGMTVVVTLVLVILLTFLIGYTRALVAPVVMVLSSVLVVAGGYYLFLSDHLLIEVSMPLVGILLATLGAVVVNYIFETRQKEYIKRKLSSKVSSSVMEDLLASKDETLLSAKDREVTIFFSDIRSFTTLSETMEPSKLVAFLNRYFTPMSDTIMRYEGTIDKYIGDAIMAYWNAPRDVANHQDKAVQAALEQCRLLKEMNLRSKVHAEPEIHIGIGITTGLVTVGEMGSLHRSDYTVIGDTVNLGSRLEGLCQRYGVAIMISDETRQGLTIPFWIRFVDRVLVKGRHDAVSMYEVLDEQNYTSYQGLEEHLVMYDRAIALYYEKQFGEADHLFSVLETQQWANPTLYRLYRERCSHYAQAPETFEAIVGYETKY